MLLRSMFAENYRSLRSIRLDLGQVNLFVGENGVGKSNLYRALQLVQAAARGTLSGEIAGEGGMASALWSGRRRPNEPVRVRLEAELIDEARALTFRYRVEAGLRPPAAAGFAFEPVNCAAIRAFDAAVGFDRQKHAWVAVPGFVLRAGAMQRQIVRGDNDGFLLEFAHDLSFYV